MSLSVTIGRERKDLSAINARLSPADGLARLNYFRLKISNQCEVPAKQHDKQATRAYDFNMDQGGVFAPGNNALIAKLELAGKLGEEDRELLRAVCSKVRRIEAGLDIVSEGAKADHVHLVLSGWAARYKLVGDGSRQITAFLIPGDFCDAHVAILRRMDHSIVAVTQASVAYISHEDFDQLPVRRPELARALWWATLVDESVLRAWIVNLGRRDAYAGIAHLICELHARLHNVGLVEDDGFELPLTQEVLADALGLTPVHTNRIIQRLRAERLVTLKSGRLAILDAAGLRRAADFDPDYLHAALRNGNGKQAGSAT